MKKQWIETFKMWGETGEYRSRIREAEKVISLALDVSKYPYVAYSGGKDSLVMLNMVLHQKQDVDVWHWDYGEQLMPRYLEKEVLENARNMGVRNIVISKREGNTARLDYVAGYRQFFGTLKRLKQKYNWDLGFVGIKKEESLSRKVKYNKFFIDDCCYPLLELTWKDVWSYIILNNLFYPSFYDRYSELLGWKETRFVTFFDKEFDKIGASNVDGVLMPEFRNLEN